MKRIPITGIVFFVFLISLPGFTQTEDASVLTLERIFSSNEFYQERFGPARWLEDGSGYTTLERSEAENGSGRDIVQYTPGSGTRKVLIPASRLIPPGEESPLQISDYSWSSDGKHLLVFTNTKRVWRQNTRGDYWILDLKTWSLEQIGKDFEPSRLMYAKFSPQADRVAYVFRNNIYSEDCVNHTITQITYDGSATIINGTFDWVYEEEFGLRDGFRWSPDGRYIAYWQLDAEGIRDFYMINNTDSLYPFIIPIQYPKVGTTNSACRVGVVSAAGGDPKWLNVPGDSRNNYIARMDWAANSEELVLQHLNRLQNTNEVMLGDIRTGKVRSVFVDRDSAWVDIGNDLKWMDNGRRFIFVSEQDGWRHAYLISRNGDMVTCITPGDYDVIHVVHIDDTNGWLYYMASPENPTQQYLYRTRLNGKGKPQCISPDNQKGTHGYQMSPDAKWAIHTYSSFTKVPVIELVRLPDHKKVRTLVENRTLRDKFQSLKRREVEFFRVNIGDGIELDVYQMKPEDFNPAKKYPVLFHVYGEPAGQTVLDRWSGAGYLWHLMLTQQGYIVMSIDNRGTPAPRGRAWRKSIYKQVGILASADQAAAVRIIRQWDYVDSCRVGVWGWSGGGSMTLNAMFRYPDLYHTGMSVAPVPDQHLYDTIYQERYMGLPGSNEEFFVKGSPITYAKNLKGSLLIVHGTGDDNVHYQGTERLINELVKYNKSFTMMAYPNRSHGIYEGENTTRHLYELLTRYLKENLPPGPAEQ